MAERLGLRLRFALFFAALALGGVALIVLGLSVGLTRSGGPADGYVIAGMIGGFGLIGLAVWVGFLFDENVAKPILALSSELHTRAQSEVASDIDTAPARYLGALAPAAQAIHGALEETRSSLEAALEQKLAVMTRDKALLEALLRELADAVVVISADGRILLYNRVATELLGPLGLDRRIVGFLRTEPVMDAVSRLEAQGGDHEVFLTASVDGSRLIRGAVANIALAPDRIAHVLHFRDTTEDLRSRSDLERLFEDTVEAAQTHVAALRDAVAATGSSPDTRALLGELSSLSRSLSEARDRETALEAGHWPIRKIPLQQVFDALELRLAAPIHVQTTDLRASCDGFAMTETLTRIAQLLDGRTDLDVSSDTSGGQPRIVLGWTGAPLAPAELAPLLDAPLAEAYGPYAIRDALAAHRTAITVEKTGDGGRILLPLPAANGTATARASSPVDFYDFDLSAGLDPELEGRSLDSLSFVVFDTETTGLDPERDAVVQIAGVRVLSGRLLRGESFDRLVNPGRPIPAVSTGIHGISDSMVQGAPGFADVALRFRDFCEGSVLVAHHAAFDLAFLRRLGASGGPAIEQPALCTALLSSRLFPHTGEHTLDALAERFGITIPDEVRHTALGDSIATAEVLLKMVPLLKAEGLVSLGDVLDYQGLG